MRRKEAAFFVNEQLVEFRLHFLGDAEILPDGIDDGRHMCVPLAVLQSELRGIELPDAADVRVPNRFSPRPYGACSAWAIRRLASAAETGKPINPAPLTFNPAARRRLPYAANCDDCPARPAGLRVISLRRP